MGALPLIAYMYLFKQERCFSSDLISSIRLATETVLLGFIRFLAVVHSGFYSKITKKKSVSNGNELKKCIKQVNDGRYISTTQRYIGLKSDQLSQAVELV